jgi:preprotein translocase subunit YajC
MFLATTTPDAAQQAGGLGAMLMSLSPFLIVIPLMYFLMIRPQKKRQKEEQKMRNSVRVGDEITTIGGITGRVLNIKDDALVIETGADRTKMTIKKWALQSVDTIHDNDDFDDDDDDDDI